MAPGIAILKFPQGIVEIVLRVATAVLVLIAVITAAAAIGITNTDKEDIFEFAERFKSVSDRAQELVDLRDNTYGSAGYVVAIGVLALLTQIAMIVLRFLNIDSINSSNIFATVNVILSFFFGVGLLAGGISMAVFAADYADFIDDASGDAQDELEMIRNALAASSAFSLLGMIASSFLGVWMVLFLVRKWNEKLKETS